MLNMSGARKWLEQASDSRAWSKQTIHYNKQITEASEKSSKPATEAKQPVREQQKQLTQLKQPKQLKADHG